jgi:hypothetical protein
MATASTAATSRHQAGTATWSLVMNMPAEATPRPGAADLVLTGGRVLTANGQRAQALAVRGDTIVAVGSSADIAAWTGPRTEVVNLAGRLVTPGFVDPHTHFAVTSFEPVAVDCRMPPLRDKTAVLDAIGAAASAAPAGQWIAGFGYSARTGSQPSELTRGDLDAVAPDNPVCVTDWSMHCSYANSAALTLAAVSRETRDPDGGGYLRDPDGTPNGVLLERAMDEIYGMSLAGLARVYGDDTVAGLIHQNAMRYLALGITTTADAAVTPDAAPTDAAADARRRRPLTLHEMRAGTGFFAEPDPRWAGSFTAASHTGRLRGDTMKLFMDPVFPQPAGYKIHADGTQERLGRPYYQPERAAQLARDASGRGLNVAIHCLGTWAIDLALDAIEVAVRTSVSDRQRHRLEHFLTPTAQQIKRAADLGITAVVQPAFMYQSGEQMAGRSAALGLDVPPMPLRRMLDEGMRIALSSDFPCGVLDPLLGIFSLISRQTRETLDPVAPDQAVSADEALDLYTRAGAEVLHRESEVGTIEAGRRADLVVLSHDIAAIEPGMTREVKVEQTFVDGRRVYDKWGRAAPG